MNNMSKEKTSFELTPSFILLLAVSCGVAVASLYYIQPLESMIAVDFGVSVGNIGFAAMLTQIGYALGLFFIVPLGDIFERRSLIIRMLVLVVIALIGVTISRNYVFFALALFIVGITSIVPQLIIPYAAQLAKPEKRGSVLGTVMGGLLIGILLSRTFSGMIGSVLGWRPVYLFATGLILLLLLIIRITFPKSYPTTKVSYLYLLRSIPQLVKNQRVLQASAVNGFFMFGSFSVFWTSLIFLLESPEYHMGTREAGLVGLVGVVGALAAPIIGKFNDKGDPGVSVGIGTVLSALAYICFWFFGYQLIGLISGVIILDLGNQSAQVSNQARIQALGDEVRSRNNTVYMSSYFIGGALGSFLGTLSWQMYGWHGVCAVGLLFQMGALIAHYLMYKEKK